MRNLNFSNANITGTSNNLSLGVLAGENRGTIENVSVVGGLVTGGNNIGITAGGLVGRNSGTITGSRADLDVRPRCERGQSQFRGWPRRHQSRRDQHLLHQQRRRGGAFGTVGGLVGQNGLVLPGPGGGNGQITSSFATGPVRGQGDGRPGRFELGGFDHFHVACQR